MTDAALFQGEIKTKATILDKVQRSRSWIFDFHMDHIKFRVFKIVILIRKPVIVFVYF